MTLISEFVRAACGLHFMIHKKCDIANLTLVFAFKQNKDDKRTNLTSLLFVFECCLLECALHKYAFMKNNENE